MGARGAEPEQGASPSADADATYRGFLFADLRGYTAFVERHGNDAAADLLDAYRALVRDEVSRHAGAEVRTEGDSFYVVFPSARRAVSCGLAIVDAADRFRRDHPERPIRVGIGINAGETVQRGEGYVGTAVNLAARVCAQAQAGEVLITSAVRDAVGVTAGLRFVARGSRRLKGISRPVPLFAVAHATTRAHRGVLPRMASIPRRAVGIVAAAAVLLTIAAFAVTGWPWTRPTSGPGVSPAAVSSVPGSSATTSAAPSADPAAFPNPVEAELLTKLGPSIADHCTRADDEDRPIMRIDQETAAAFNLPQRLPLPVDAGLRCRVPSIAAPDTVYFWQTGRLGQRNPVAVPEALIHSRAGGDSIPLGDCFSTPVAYGEWQLGDIGGWLLCRELYGDAIITWSYDGSPLLGEAVRRDGDLAALLRWWMAEARLLRP